MKKKEIIVQIVTSVPLVVNDQGGKRALLLAIVWPEKQTCAIRLDIGMVSASWKGLTNQPTDRPAV